MNIANEHRFGEALHAAQGRADRIANATAAVVREWDGAVLTAKSFDYIVADVERALREERHNPSVQEVVLQGQVYEWRKLALDLASKAHFVLGDLRRGRYQASEGGMVMLKEIDQLISDILKKGSP